MALVSAFDGFIFDYGGVLVHNQSPEAHERMAGIAGVPVSRFGDLYWRDRADYDKGALEAWAYWRALAEVGGKPLSDAEVAELTEIDTVTWMVFDSAMWDWIEDLKRSGKRVAVLSNMPKDLGAALKTRTNRLTQFHHVTLSYELGDVKPDPPIYEHCLKGIGTDRSRTLFLDDRAGNVAAAERLGIPSMRFTSHEELLARLQA